MAETNQFIILPKRKRFFLFATIAIFTLTLLGAFFYGGFQISKSRTFQFFGGLTSRVETDEKIVALTFDDAPSSYTAEVLKILAERNIKGTFYAVGQSLEKFPEEGKQIVAPGHELGNHSYSHQRFLLKTKRFVQDEIEKTNELIRKTGYAGEITFRPPYGKKLFSLPWYLHKHDIKTIMWDVEPDTYHPGDAEAMTEYTLANTKPGSIILLHPFCDVDCAADREALPKIIDELKTQGFTFVTISELLQRQSS